VFLYDRHQGPGDPQHMRAVGPLARRDRVLVRAIRAQFGASHSGVRQGR